MSLTEIMSHSDLSIYPQIALVIFLVVFAITALRVFLSRRARSAHTYAANLPLDDGFAATPSAAQGRDATQKGADHVD